MGISTEIADTKDVDIEGTNIKDTGIENDYIWSTCLYNAYTRDISIGFASIVGNSNSTWIKSIYTRSTYARDICMGKFNIVKYSKLHLQVYQILKVRIILFGISWLS